MRILYVGQVAKWRNVMVVIQLLSPYLPYVTPNLCAMMHGGDRINGRHVGAIKYEYTYLNFGYGYENGRIVKIVFSRYAQKSDLFTNNHKIERSLQTPLITPRAL